MWIQIIGATGTGKEHVLNLITKEGYEFVSCPLLKNNLEKTNSDPFLTEVAYASSRLRTDFTAAKVADRKDVVTIRGFYESRDIFVPALSELTTISEKQHEDFNLIYNFAHDELLTPPEVVIYCKAEKINALNRAALRGVSINDDFYTLQANRYEEYAKKLRVPVIEIDALASPDLVQKNLEFGLSSIKTARLSSRTIWDRTMFWSKEVYDGKNVRQS